MSRAKTRSQRAWQLACKYRHLLERDGTREFNLLVSDIVAMVRDEVRDERQAISDALQQKIDNKLETDRNRFACEFALRYIRGRLLRG